MGNPTINSVTVVYPNSTAAASSFVATNIVSVTAGDFLGIFTRNSATSMASIADNAAGGSNTYSSTPVLTTNPTGAARNQSIRFFYVLACKTTGTLTLTFTFNTSEGEAAIGLDNFVAVIYDITPSAGGTVMIVDTASKAVNTTPNSSPQNSITTAAFSTLASDLILCWCSADNINLSSTFTGVSPIVMDQNNFPSGRDYCGAGHAQLSGQVLNDTLTMGSGANAFIAIYTVGIYNLVFDWLGQGDVSGDWMDSNGIYLGIQPSSGGGGINTPLIAQFQAGNPNCDYTPGILALLASGNVFDITVAYFEGLWTNLIPRRSDTKVR